MTIRHYELMIRLRAYVRLGLDRSVGWFVRRVMRTICHSQTELVIPAKKAVDRMIGSAIIIPTRKNSVKRRVFSRRRMEFIVF